jgi:DNA-binding MarR family transcriptional regulator
MKRDQQRAKLEACSQCACFNLRKATRALTQLYDRSLRPYGLRAAQFQVLAVIGGRGPVNISDLAKALVMDRTTVSRELAPLERQGWVTVRAGKDRRTRAVELTANGWRLLEDALPAWKQTQESVVEGLGIDSFGVLLEKLSSTVKVARETGESV